MNVNISNLLNANVCVQSPFYAGGAERLNVGLSVHVIGESNKKLTQLPADRYIDQLLRTISKSVYAQHTDLKV